MRELQVNVEISGENKPVGRLLYNDSSDAIFKYDRNYLASDYAMPISISLPLQQEAFSILQSRTFFEGLLPEGFTRRTVAEWLRVDENDYISILHGLGNECLGAIQIVDEEDQVSNLYEPLSVEEIKRLANEGSSKSAEIIVATHLSLAGASGKVGLYWDSNQNKWYLPKGKAPSTHIVKQSHVRLNNLVANEQLSLMTAKMVGVNVANSFIVDTGSKQDGDVLLASERYDRTFAGAKKTISGMLCPLRLHQEDFSQALGISSSSKYEREGMSYLGKMFALLRTYSANPLEDTAELWRRMIFNVLIGNCDGHIKNNALLYSSNLKSIRLAPAYDIVSTVIYKPFNREMSIYLGGENSLDKINMDVLIKAAVDAGLGQRFAVRTIDKMKKEFPAALKKSALILKEQGFDAAEDICEQILTLGGINNL